MVQESNNNKNINITITQNNLIHICYIIMTFLAMCTFIYTILRDNTTTSNVNDAINTGKEIVDELSGLNKSASVLTTKIAGKSPEKAEGIVDKYLSNAPDKGADIVKEATKYESDVIQEAAEQSIKKYLQNLIRQLDNGAKEQRETAIRELSDNLDFYPALIPELIKATKGKIQYQSPSGSWNVHLINTLDILRKLDAEILLDHKAIIEPVLDEVFEKCGPITQGYARQVQKKLK